MDDPGNFRYFPAMQTAIPAWQLYGEASPFPDLLHIERIVDRAAGLDWRIAPHRHHGLHQIFHISRGAIQLTSDGETLAPDLPAVLNVPRGTVHGFAFRAGTEGHVLTLPAADFPELFGPGAETAAALAQTFVATPDADLGAAKDTLADLHATPGPLRRLRLRAAAITLCCLLVRNAPQAATPAAVADPRLTRLEQRVRAALAQPPRLPDLARDMGLSERHLQRLCRQATGLSAHGFIEQIRLREACRLLAYTRMRVQEVGFALGFDDPAYFARAFRRGTGLSPAAYRARLDAGGAAS
jgi:AraC family transcriptional activator of pobA